MTSANNQHAATDATLRQIFKAMDAHQTQEIREAYYKAIEGLMTLAETLEIADAQTNTQRRPASHRTLQRGPSPGRDEEQPPWKDPLSHRPAECHGRRERKRGVLPLGRDTRLQSRSCEHLRPSTQPSKHRNRGQRWGPQSLPSNMEEHGEKLLKSACFRLNRMAHVCHHPATNRFHHAIGKQTMSRTNARTVAVRTAFKQMPRAHRDGPP